jgi:hypothetical protein
MVSADITLGKEYLRQAIEQATTARHRLVNVDPEIKAMLAGV